MSPKSVATSSPSVNLTPRNLVSIKDYSEFYRKVLDHDSLSKSAKATAAMILVQMLRRAVWQSHAQAAAERLAIELRVEGERLGGYTHAGAIELITNGLLVEC